jgi:hypothetical protein
MFAHRRAQRAKGPGEQDALGLYSPRPFWRDVADNVVTKLQLLLVFRFQDGLIREVREYMDTQLVTETFGTDGNTK